MSRKTRSDSKLASLPPEQREKLKAWLVDENLNYDEAVSRVRSEFGVRTSKGALSSFYRLHCFALRSSEAKAFAEEAVKQVQARENLDEATLLLVQQKAFEQAYARNGDLDALAVLAKIIADSKKLQIKQQEVSLSERRIKLLEQKAALADQATGIEKDQSLTDEEKAAKMRALFRM